MNSSPFGEINTNQTMKPQNFSSLKQFDLYKLLGPLMKEYLKCKPIGSIIIVNQSIFGETQNAGIACRVGYSYKEA